MYEVLHAVDVRVENMQYRHLCKRLPWPKKSGPTKHIPEKLRLFQHNLATQCGGTCRERVNLLPTCAGANHRSQRYEARLQLHLAAPQNELSRWLLGVTFF